MFYSVIRSYKYPFPVSIQDPVSLRWWKPPLIIIGDGGGDGEGENCLFILQGDGGKSIVLLLKKPILDK